MSTVTTDSTKITSAKDVLLYIPNLIGYARVILAISSVVVLLLSVDDNDNDDSDNKNSNMLHTTYIAIMLYILAFAGDAIDGVVARQLQQTSNFGSVLDMITDRCSTLAWLYVLGIEYSSYYSHQHYNKYYRILFCFLAVLDIASHWVQMHSSLSSLADGSQHHKSDEGNRNKHFLVRWFYKYKAFFAYLCIGAEFTYILLLLRSRLLKATTAIVTVGAAPTTDQEQREQDLQLLMILRTIIDYCLIVTIPACVLKQMVNIAQLMSSCYAIAHHDATEKNNCAKQQQQQKKEE